MHLLLHCSVMLLHEIEFSSAVTGGGASGNQPAALGYVVQAPGLVMTPLEWTTVLSLLSNPPKLLPPANDMSYKRHPLAGDLTYTWQDKRAWVRRFLLFWGLHDKRHRVRPPTYTLTDHHPLSPHFLTLFLAPRCLEPRLWTNWISSDPVDHLSEGLGYDLKWALLRGQTQPI